MQLDNNQVDRIIKLALEEDIGKGDITSNITIPADKTAEFVIRTREPLIVCGIEVAKQVFWAVSGDIKLDSAYKDGDALKTSDIILSGKGNARAILAAERVALNLLRQMCGVATLTHKFVTAVSGTKAKILDTRKTIPGLRHLQKYAVTIGGGQNHRYCLDDMILIKDNHISVCGGVLPALKKAKEQAPKGIKIELECDTLEQVKQALEGKADIILLDNMDIATLKEAVRLVEGKIPLEASGNVNLNTVGEIAKTGVDFISAGVLTNSPMSLDIGLDIDI
ncbi:MAG: nicotinate-nucleotide pyrophosphorylase [Rickettsiaceae bacterium]|jgi:nicotinate-nucleotide pyrophosphorylase (carboxylating)|nr:nicotinate-nucleotide pyrophosphorylase [Rickettsiaceae bacterium]